MDSDVDVSRWVLELLLRDREKECIAKRVLAVAPFSDQDYRLKKTVLLRTIECEVHDASISETILETLETIEGLDIGQGIATSDAMKAAFLAVATECTVKFLAGFMGKPSGKYLEAVDRIWRGRIGALERGGASRLVSGELKQRMDEVEAGVWDLRVSKKLSRMNTRNDALRLVAVYLKEALALLGPPFITWAVRLNVPKEDADLESDRITVANEGNVGGGSEVEAQTQSRENVEVQMENGSNVEVQMVNRSNVVDGTEMEAQMANEGSVGGGRAVLEAQMANGANVGGESELVVQMAKGANEGDGTEVEEQMVNGSNVGGGSKLEVQTRNGSNAAAESGMEARMVSGANVGDGPESEAQTVNGTNVGDGSQLEDSPTVNRANVVNESPREVQTTSETNVGVESELEAQPVNGTNTGDGCELRGQMVNRASVRYESEVGPEPMSGVQLQEVGAGSLTPTVSRGLVLNDFVEMGSGFRNREVRLPDDQVGGEVNETGLALPSVNRELALSFDSTMKETQRSSGLRHKHLAHRRTRGPVKIRDAEDLDKDLSNNKNDSLSTPEVSKAQEALKSSILELRAVVSDPLPNALRVAETVRSDVETKSVNHVNGKDVGAENQSVGKGVPQSSGKETDVPNPPANLGKGTESVQIGDDNLGSRSISNHNNVPRPSLMERNATACTYEWDDSIDMSQEGTRKDTDRLHLPSPKRMAVSPLKKHENKRFTKRRKVKRWSLMEEDALRTGVQKYGQGNWKFILNSYRSIFEERTEVDLKDKWRNMTK